MMRLTAVFVAVCMALISISFGVALHYLLGLSAAEASIVSVAALTGLAIYNAVLMRARVHGDISTQIADLSRGTADLAKQLSEFDRRVAAAEVKVNTAVDMAVAAAKPVAAEIDELGALVNQLAMTVATHDTALARVYPVTAAASLQLPAAPAPSTPVAPVFERTQSERESDASPTIASGRFKGVSQSAITTTLRHAIDANRLDLYLQPIVTLPQRKVRFYEALVRLRTEDGELLTPTDFLSHAESAGLMPRIDNLMLFRSGGATPAGKKSRSRNVLQCLERDLGRSRILVAV
jgi:cyclic-di-GMP phosphodiesterase, flagellum assembly factor TipF